MFAKFRSDTTGRFIKRTINQLLFGLLEYSDNLGRLTTDFPLSIALLSLTSIISFSHFARVRMDNLDGYKNER